MTKPITEIAEREMLIKLLNEFDNHELSLALVYAKNLRRYGIDVESKWETASQQSAALSTAYNDGYYAGYEKGIKGRKE